MDSYKKQVILSITAQDRSIILNSDIKHAAILIEQMFLHAKYSACLISNSMLINLYKKDFVIDAIRYFLNKNDTQLSIVVEENIDNNPALLDILKLYSGKIHIKQAEKWLSDQYQFNFLLTDDNNYRYEADRNKHEATAEFGNKDRVAKLQTLFTKIHTLAKPVDISSLSTT